MSQSERGDEYLWQGCPGIVLRFQERCAWAEGIGRSLLDTSILCVHTGESWGWKNMRNSQPEQIYACTSSKATTPIIRALGQVKPSSQCQNTWDFPSSVIVMLHLQLRWWLHFKINQYNLTKRYSNQHFRWQQAGSKLGILNGWLMLQKLWAQVLLVQTIRSTDFKSMQDMETNIWNWWVPLTCCCLFTVCQEKLNSLPLHLGFSVSVISESRAFYVTSSTLLDKM